MLAGSAVDIFKMFFGRLEICCAAGFYYTLMAETQSSGDLCAEGTEYLLEQT